MQSAALTPERHGLLFRLLAATGLRISEAFALQWRHVQLAGGAHVKVRRAYVRGKLDAPLEIPAGGNTAPTSALPVPVRVEDLEALETAS